MEIARLRAARVLWAKIVKAFGGNDIAAMIWDAIEARLASR